MRTARWSSSVSSYRRGPPEGIKQAWEKAKESTCSAGAAGDMGSIPGLNPWGGKIPWGGNVSPLQHSCLENHMDGGGWWATVHGSQRVRHDWSYLAHKPERNVIFGFLHSARVRNQWEGGWIQCHHRYNW